jgi:hypothetical protein
MELYKSMKREQRLKLQVVGLASAIRNQDELKLAHISPKLLPGKEQELREVQQKIKHLSN